MTVWIPILIALFGWQTILHAAAANPQAIKAMKQKRAGQAAGRPAGMSAAKPGPKLTPQQMNALIEQLKTTSAIWPKIPGDSNRGLAISYFVNEYKKKGTAIKKSPNHYAVMITGMTSQNPALLKLPFERLLQTVAIIEYDFDNGQDKDALAKKILGEAGYLRNKKRLAAAPKPAPRPSGARSPSAVRSPSAGPPVPKSTPRPR